MKEMIVADLRDIPEDLKAHVKYVETEQKLSLDDFLSNAAYQNGHFFINVILPNEEVFTAKYKFSKDIFVPERYARFLDNVIEEIWDIFDDGGFGSFIFLGKDKVYATD